MLGGHLPELMIVLVLALVVFGPKRLPEIGSSLGQGIKSFKHGVSHLHDEPVVAEPAVVPVMVNTATQPAVAPVMTTVVAPMPDEKSA